MPNQIECGMCCNRVKFKLHLTQRKVQLTGEGVGGGKLHREGGTSGGSALKRNQSLSGGD